ncbi:NOG1 family protein [Halorarius halobius]|uniref:NOG1 family protein n=1 Tax=Halorarius halobius TaxID=2962671 RepID=UPI0020CD5C9C|nr:GTPase [Halorarius halobius]
MTTFEDLPTTPRSEELIDKAFSRAARAGNAKQGVEAQESMLQTAANILSDNTENVVTSWPDFDAIDPFYRELADAIVAREDLNVDTLRQHLSEVMWASRQCDEIKNEYHGRIRNADPETARKLRKQAFARLASVVREVEGDLFALADAREELRQLPDIRPDEPAVVVAGYPNVGKSSFVNRVTRADNDVDTYPFTTTQIRVGHFERDRIRYQLVDTPGLLDRPADERNAIESQAVSALTHLADAVLFLVDPSESCGYPLEAQLALRDDVEQLFADAAGDEEEVPVLTVCNKSDQSRDVEADCYMSVADGEGVEETLDAAVEAVDWEIALPFEEN